MQKIKAVILNCSGGPEHFDYVDAKLPDLGANEVRLKQDAIGFNMIDTYMRKGIYPVELPAILGVEAAGIIEEVGAEVTEFAPGDRVGYFSHKTGAYASHRNISADELVFLPEELDSKVAAATLLKGMTAHMLLRSIYPIKPGDQVLVYAAAGGVGSVLCPWAKLLGAEIIGVVGSEAKREQAKKLGCDHVLVRGQDNIVESIADLTAGKGVSVVYDSLGRDTFDTSLGCLAPRGLMVSYGNATGPVEPVSLLDLMRAGSVFVTRPQLFHYFPERQCRQEAADELFDLFLSGTVGARINHIEPLSNAAAVHKRAKTGETTGATVLTP